MLQIYHQLKICCCASKSSVTRLACMSQAWQRPRDISNAWEQKTTEKGWALAFSPLTAWWAWVSWGGQLEIFRESAVRDECAAEITVVLQNRSDLTDATTMGDWIWCLINITSTTAVGFCLIGQFIRSYSRLGWIPQNWIFELLDQEF